MPCYEARRQSDDSDECNRLRDRLDVVTQIACNAMNVIEKLDALRGCSDQAREWWEAHREFDRKRREQGEG